MPDNQGTTLSSGEVVRNDDRPYDSKLYRNYVLLLLTITYAFNFIDRQIMVILQESIKQDLGLSDSQLGLLTGIAFAAFYVIMGIPVARLADRWVRRSIMSIATGTWSLMTVLCGMAQNFPQLLLARIGVGVGESGCSPPAHSIISDIYPPEKRATALSIYSVGLNIGILFGFLLGGWINEYYGWRMAFIIVGVPGILIALLLQFTIREPVRGATDAIKSSGEMPSFMASMKMMMGKKAFRHVAIGASCFTLIGYGGAIWFAPYMLRNFEIQTGELGTWLALGSGILGGLGTLVGGYLADKKGRQDRRWYTWVPTAAVAITLPFLYFTYTLDSMYLVLSLFMVPATMATVFMGPSIAMVQGMVEARMRALASAVLFFTTNIIGLGLGPFLIGIGSDMLSDDFGTRSVGYSVLIVSFVAAAVGIWQFTSASRHINEDMQAPHTS